MLIRSALFLTQLFLSQSLVFANPWCIDREVSSNIKQIGCLYTFDACPKSIDVPHSIRKGFDEILRRRERCPKCEEVTINEQQYLNLYHLPFLVLALTSPIHGSPYSFDVHIVFKGGPKQVFEVGMNCRDGGGYELQSIVDVDSSKKTKKLIKELARKEYVSYWIE